MKQKVYLPIAVSSGELPVVEDKTLSVDVAGITQYGGITICYYDFYNNVWNKPITHWLKESIIGIPTKEEREKELSECWEAAINFKHQQDYWEAPNEPDKETYIQQQLNK